MTDREQKEEAAVWHLQVRPHVPVRVLRDLRRAPADRGDSFKVAECASVGRRKADMPTQKLSNEIISAAITGFEEQKRRIESRISEVRAMLSGGRSKIAVTPEASTRKRKKFSAATRRRMKEAQQRRWARIRGAEASRPERRLSAAGRKAIQEALRRRWAMKRDEAAKTQRAAKKAIAIEAVVKTAATRAVRAPAPVKKAVVEKAAKRKAAPKKSPAKKFAAAAPAAEPVTQ